MTNIQYQMSNKSQKKKAAMQRIRNLIFDIGTYLTFSMRGQSLIESLFALTIIAVLLTIVTVGITSALSNAQASKNRNLAEKYAGQGMEIMRQMKDSDWSRFSVLSGKYCMASTCTNLGLGNCGSGSSCGINIQEGFSRQVNIEQNSSSCPATPAANSFPNATHIVITVSWADSKCVGATYCKEVSVESCFGNLQGDPTL